MSSRSRTLRRLAPSGGNLVRDATDAAAAAVEDALAWPHGDASAGAHPAAIGPDPGAATAAAAAAAAAAMAAGTGAGVAPDGDVDPHVSITWTLEDYALARSIGWTMRRLQAWRDNITAGHLCDCRDNDGVWNEARVELVVAATRELKIHFIGWERRWDVWKTPQSPSVAPRGSKVFNFRRFAAGQLVELNMPVARADLQGQSRWFKGLVTAVDVPKQLVSVRLLEGRSAGSSHNTFVFSWDSESLCAMGTHIPELCVAVSENHEPRVADFLQRGSDLHRREFSSGRCFTPLHLAIKAGHTRLVHLLLAYCADMHATDARGNSVTDVAVEFGRADMIEELVSGASFSFRLCLQLWGSSDDKLCDAMGVPWPLELLPTPVVPAVGAMKPPPPPPAGAGARGVAPPPLPDSVDSGGGGGDSGGGGGTGDTGVASHDGDTAGATAALTKPAHVDHMQRVSPAVWVVRSLDDGLVSEVLRLVMPMPPP